MTTYTVADEARAAALTASQANPSAYVTLFACFGLAVVINKRLHVFAPSDSWGRTYWRNGTEKAFTKKQIAADWKATPAMN